MRFQLPGLSQDHIETLAELFAFPTEVNGEIVWGIPLWLQEMPSRGYMSDDLNLKIEWITPTSSSQTERR